MRVRKIRRPKITKILKSSKNLRTLPTKRGTRSVRRRRRTSVGMMIAKEVVIKDTEVNLVNILEVCFRALLACMVMTLKCMVISKILETWLDVPSPTTWWKSSSSPVKGVVPPSFILPSMTLICTNLNSKILSLLVHSLQGQHRALDPTTAFQVVNQEW